MNQPKTEWQAIVETLRIDEIRYRRKLREHREGIRRAGCMYWPDEPDLKEYLDVVGRLAEAEKMVEREEKPEWMAVWQMGLCPKCKENHVIKEPPQPAEPEKKINPGTEHIHDALSYVFPRSKPAEPEKMPAVCPKNALHSVSSIEVVKGGDILGLRKPYGFCHICNTLFGGGFQTIPEKPPAEPCEHDWISVKDRLPEDRTYVLVYYNEIHNTWSDADGDPHFVVAKFVLEENPEPNNTKNYSWDTFGPLKLFGQDVDFWMPLPQAPDNTSKDSKNGT